MAEEMTPEELAAIELYIRSQNDPFALSANALGQGPGFLDYESTPDSWDRLADKNDLYSDLFRMTRTYLPDFVSGLHPEVEDPGRYQGYTSDAAGLYSGNPAYESVRRMVEEEGTPFEEAVKLVKNDPDLAEFMPDDDRDFRQSAQQYVTDAGRENRERSQWEAEAAAYDDYVRARSGLDVFAQPDVESRMRSERSMDYMEDPIKTILSFGGTTDRPEVAAERRAAQGWTPGEVTSAMAPMPNGAEQTPSNQSSSPKRARRSTPRTSGRSRSEQRAFARSAAKTGKAYNDSYRAAAEFQKRRMAAQAMPSKKEENLAKLVAAYNSLMYGQ